MEAGVMSSYAQMVCDNEIANSVHRICRGLVADENALAVDVIAAVMGGPRNFLGQKHTSCALRSGEMFLTHLAERQSWESWVREGRLGMIERSQAEAERLLAEHQVQPLSEDQERELDAIMLEAERKLVSK
jgi:trimethylamine:corrinoid methyltransferase-like protein